MHNIETQLLYSVYTVEVVKKKPAGKSPYTPTIEGISTPADTSSVLSILPFRSTTLPGEALYTRTGTQELRASVQSPLYTSTLPRVPDVPLPVPFPNQDYVRTLFPFPNQNCLRSFPIYQSRTRVKFFQF